VQVHNPKSIHAPVGNYSHGIAVPPNCRVLFVAGHVVWQNIKAIVEDAGMKLTDIVKLTVLLTDAANLAKMAEVRKQYLGDHKPAVTGFAVKSLVRPEWLIEIDAIAMKPVVAPRAKAAKRPARKAAKRRK
jgi:hypothetical protein